MNTLLEKTGFWLARYLQKEVKGYKPSSTSDVSKLKKCLRPGDIQRWSYFVGQVGGVFKVESRFNNYAAIA